MTLTLSKGHKRIRNPLPLHIKGLAPVQAVSLLSLSAEACFRSQASTCGICVGQGDTGTCFTPNT